MGRPPHTSSKRICRPGCSAFQAVNARAPQVNTARSAVRVRHGLSNACVRDRYRCGRPGTCEGASNPAPGITGIQPSVRLKTEVASVPAGRRVATVLLTDVRQKEQVAEYVAAGNTAQLADRCWADELRKWIRFNGREAVRTGDGLYGAVMGRAKLRTPGAPGDRPGSAHCLHQSAGRSAGPPSPFRELPRHRSLPAGPGHPDRARPRDAAFAPAACRARARCRMTVQRAGGHDHSTPAQDGGARAQPGA
jgi:hypothetical protein